VEEIAPPQAIAEFDRLIGVQAEHNGCAPLRSENSDDSTELEPPPQIQAIRYTEVGALTLVQ
jgi:hypothetical protein